MELPFILTFFGSWLSISAGIYGLFNKAGESVNEPTRRAVADWLQNIKLDRELPNWPQTFAVLFDSVFTDKHWSWQCLGRSMIASVVTFILLIMSFSSLDSLRDLAIYTSTFSSFLETAILGLIAGLILNFIPDYLSLLETRVLLSKISHSKARFRTIKFLVTDFSVLQL